MKIGILALQGAFIEHAKILQKIGVETIEIRQKNDINKGSWDFCLGFLCLRSYSVI